MTRQLRRQGYPQVSDKMLEGLVFLRESREFEILNLHHRTIRAMQNYDLIIHTNGYPDGLTRYKITGRGLKTLAAYEKVVKRDDGICKTCGEHPRTSRYPNGQLYPYCDECMKAHGRAKYAMKGYQLDPETRCSKCHRNRRLKLPNGQVIAYCKRCRKFNRKKERRAKMKRRLALIQAGTPPLCCRCKTEPVYQAGKTVYDYCHTCYRQQQAEAALRRKQRSFSKKLNKG